jgi:hypothetical protein
MAAMTENALFVLPALRRARDLIDRDDAEICFLVGFASLGSFSTRFRELVGWSPSEYRDDAVARAGTPPIPGCVVLMWTRPHADVEQSGRSGAGAGPTRVVAAPQLKEHR